ncbi:MULTISPECIES: hypothetical protein [unclassified Thermosynechococcus]|uniref:hypothetical protein n=1 Tax=unclassified Thermosynechococcus TaxID=2622553 RepID=UPI00197DAE94|nr:MULTISPECIES: hypothetical protein [unclassified Thermosynechococcus]QSF49994.1 hypothetical protein JW907_04385 [Thermosynechococcus sp. TA-1]WNC23102.1 hypothetical protein RHG98_04355 [Thermosynechococcus sp. PP22]WNC33340.1 hypothetical protein RHH81_04360 [Thermosynechococcus sp. PKX95]WNC35864.1 hypothetical protein RHH79_04355 [Thermosynechococcus sp. PKX91]WNC38387.1 hypothetical protein RHI11_04365 [Thermosynechococcus sp. WL11]
MAIALSQIAQYLQRHQLNYRLNAANHQIITGVNGDHLERFIVVIELDEGGEFFKLYAPNLLPGIKTHQFRDAILQTLLCISWQTKMLQWEYDPNEGEVRAMIEFPIEDSTLTERQFFRCLGALVEIVDNTVPRLRELVEQEPPPLDADLAMGERLLLTIQEEAPGLLDLIAQALEARRQRGRVSLNLENLDT